MRGLRFCGVCQPILQLCFTYLLHHPVFWAGSLLLPAAWQQSAGLHRPAAAVLRADQNAAACCVECQGARERREVNVHTINDPESAPLLGFVMFSAKNPALDQIVAFYCVALNCVPS